MWIAGGSLSGSTVYADVYSSTDGVTWTRATASAAFGKRRIAGMTVGLGKMWIAGGLDDSTDTKYRDVYYSTDGVTWTQATAAAGFGYRLDLGMCFLDGYLYVMGGADGAGTFLSSVYHSTDGVTWTDVSAASHWSARTSFGCVALAHRLFVVGGYDTAYINDCWVSFFSPFTYSGSATMPTAGRIDAGAGVEYGLLVGTDDADFAVTQADLVAKCEEGTGTGQIQYAAHDLTEPTDSAGKTAIQVDRDITNGSGSTITLKEVGLFLRGLNDDPLMVARAVLPDPIDILNGETITAWAELSTSV